VDDVAEIDFRGVEVRGCMYFASRNSGKLSFQEDMLFQVAQRQLASDFEALLLIAVTLRVNQ